MTVCWRTSLLGLLGLIILITGCNRQLLLPREEYDSAFLPPRLETEIVPPIPQTPVQEAPPTVLDPDRPARLLSLQQAIAISLDNGTVSSQGGPGSGISNDTMVVFTGSSILSQSDRLRVLAQLPAQAAATIEQSQARFDPKFVTSFVQSNINELTQGFGSATNGPSTQFQSSIMKAFASGGVGTITAEADYRLLTNPATNTPPLPNPLYTTKLTLAFEQPLWRDFGTEINQLLNRVAPFYGTLFPTFAQTAYGNQLNVLNQSAGLAGGGAVFTEGVLISRIRFDSQRADFERNVNNLVLNVESAYWKLYQAYGTLYSYEELLRIVHKGWMIYKSRYDTGVKDASLKEYAPILAKYHELRGNRLSALGAVLDAERNLRGIMGILAEDGTRLVPTTAPTQAYYQPNWNAAVKDALALRPELILARENLRLSQLALINQKNFLKPDLRLLAQYQPVGFGQSLDGTGQMPSGGPFAPFPMVSSNALNSIASGHYNDYTIGLVMNIPLGFRLEQAAVRQARLGLLQSYELLKDQEERATRQLCQQYQKMAEWWTRIEAATQEREAYGKALQAYFEEIRVGQNVASPPLIVILGQLAPAMLKQFEAIGQYNASLAFYEYTKGTLLQYNNIGITEGPLPVCVQVQAMEQLRKATHALPLRTRPDPRPATFVPGDAISNTSSLPPAPMLPEATGKSSVEGLWQNMPTAAAPPPSNLPAAPPLMAPNSGVQYAPAVMEANVINPIMTSPQMQTSAPVLTSAPAAQMLPNGAPMTGPAR